MRKQILLIDDDLPLCRKLREALQDDTTEVRYFIDTAEALDSFMRHRFVWLSWTRRWKIWMAENYFGLCVRPRRSRFWCSPVHYHWKMKLNFFH